METITIGSIFDKAWQLMKKNLLAVLGVFCVYFAIFLPLLFLLLRYVIPSPQFSSVEDVQAYQLQLFTSTGFWVIILLTFFVSYSSVYTLYKVILNSIDGQRFKFFINLRISMKVFIASLLGSIIIMIGFMLFIIPGIYLALRLQFIPISIIDKDLSIGEAFSESWEITKGHMGQLILLWLSFMAISLIGMLLFLVGMIPATVIIYNMVCFTYRDLVHSFEEKNGIKEIEPS